MFLLPFINGSVVSLKKDAGSQLLLGGCFVSFPQPKGHEFSSFLKTAEASLITTIINTNTMSSPCIVRWCFWNEASLKRQVQMCKNPIKVKMRAVDRYFLNVKDKWTKEPAILILKSQRWWTGDEGIHRFLQIVLFIPMRKPEDFQNSCKTAFFNTSPLLDMILWENFTFWISLKRCL